MKSHGLSARLFSKKKIKINGGKMLSLFGYIVVALCTALFCWTIIASGGF